MLHRASANKNEEGVISARLTPVKPCKAGNPSDLFHQVKQKKVSPGKLGRSPEQISFTAARRGDLWLMIIWICCSPR